MSDYKIIVDSSCDLPKELTSQVDADIASEVITIGERVYRDRKDITSQELFENVKKNHVLPTTSSLNVNDLKELFQEELTKHERIFFLTVSSELSPLYEKALFAREQIPQKERIFVLDTKEISSGMALLAMGLKKDLDQKLPIEKAIENHKNRLGKVHMSFAIDTLDYLNNGGRCSGLTFLIGSKLRLHPIVKVDDGRMSVRKMITKKNIDKAIAVIVDNFKDHLDKGNVDLSYPILIPVASCPSGLKKILHSMKDLVGDKILFPVEAGAVIASHSGPNAIGLAYMLRQKED